MTNTKLHMHNSLYETILRNFYANKDSIKNYDKQKVINDLIIDVMSNLKDSKLLTFIDHFLINEKFLDHNNKFWYYPGSTKHHHSFEYGLFIHTLEVLANVLNSSYDNYDENLIVATIFHDYYKTVEYKFDETTNKYVYNKENKISHLKRVYDIAIETQNYILANILGSHHGKIAYGCVKEPESSSEYILYLSDHLSSFSKRIVRG